LYPVDSTDIINMKSDVLDPVPVFFDMLADSEGVLWVQ
jgi:hypothetical protein